MPGANGKALHDRVQLVNGCGAVLAPFTNANSAHTAGTHTDAIWHCLSGSDLLLVVVTTPKENVNWWTCQETEQTHATTFLRRCRTRLSSSLRRMRPINNSKCRKSAQWTVVNVSKRSGAEGARTHPWASAEGSQGRRYGVEELEDQVCIHE